MIYLNKWYSYQKFCRVFQSFNSLKYSLHHPRYNSTITSFPIIIGAHCECFTRSSLIVKKTKKPIIKKLSKYWKQKKVAQSCWEKTKLTMWKLYLAICKNCGIIPMEKSINKRSNTIIIYCRRRRPRTTIDIIIGECMWTNLNLQSTQKQ